MLSRLVIARAGTADLERADDELREAARLGLTTGDMPVMAEVASAAAVLAHHRGEDERAARLLGAADTIRGRADLSNVDALAVAQALRASLGGGRSDALVAEGLAMTQDEAVAFVLQGIDRAPGS
jgi:hypothetical protein